MKKENLKKRHKIIADSYKKGIYSLAELADIFGISREGVRKIIKLSTGKDSKKVAM